MSLKNWKQISHTLPEISADLQESPSTLFNGLKFKYFMTCFGSVLTFLNLRNISKHFQKSMWGRMFLGDITPLLAIILILAFHLTAVHRYLTISTRIFCQLSIVFPFLQYNLSFQFFFFLIFTCLFPHPKFRHLSCNQSWLIISTRTIG